MAKAFLAVAMLNLKFLITLVLRLLLLLRIFLNNLQNSRDKRLLLSFLWLASQAQLTCHTNGIYVHCGRPQQQREYIHLYLRGLG